MNNGIVAALIFFVLIVISPPAYAQRAPAPVDLTGYWVSLVTEDWRFRMVTPLKGDYEGVPLNPEGRRVANAWDPARDEAQGEQCKSFGAPALLRAPGRLHISQENDTTLRIDADAGTQTRLLHFGESQQPSEPSLQGHSSAQWQVPGGRGGRGAQPRGGSKVVTNHLRAGYLRKNGVPYSASAVLTEYYNVVSEPNGGIYLVVQTFVEDPQFLNQTFIISTHFKKQADAAGWNPTPCASR